MVIFILLIISIFLNIYFLKKKQKKEIKTINEKVEIYKQFDFFNIYKDVLKENIFIFEKEKLIFFKNIIDNSNVKVKILTFNSFLQWLNKNFFTRKTILSDLVEEIRYNFINKNNYSFYLEDINYNFYTFNLIFINENLSYVLIQNITDKQNLIKNNNLYKEVIEKLVEITDNQIVILENKKYLATNLSEKVLPVPENIPLYISKGSIEIYISMSTIGLRRIITDNIIIIENLLSELNNFLKNTDFFKINLQNLLINEKIINFRNSLQQEEINLFEIISEKIEKTNYKEKIKINNFNDKNFFNYKEKVNLIIDKIVILSFFSNESEFFIYNDYLVIKGVFLDMEIIKILKNKFSLKISEDNKVYQINFN